MPKNVSARFAFTLAIAFLAVMVGYQAFVHDQAQQLVTPDSKVEEEIVAPSEMRSTASTARNTSRTDRSAASAGPVDFRRELLGMSEAHRNHIFWLTLRDAGFQCDELESSQLLGGDARAWRAYCGGALVYWVNVDDLGDISVELAPYGVPTVRPIELVPE